MASENLAIDENGRNVSGGITNDAFEFIKNFRINPTNGRLIVDAHVVSSNTDIGDTIAGGTAGSILFLGLGSTLAQDNANLFYDDTNNFVGLGNNTPSATLDLVGTFQYVDGNQSNGYVLTSDANGNATWQNNPAGTGYDTIQNSGVSVTQRSTINLSTLLTATDSGGKTALTINVANLATDSTFITDITSNTTFLNNIANSATFVTTLVANNTFTTALAGDSNFYTTLGANNNFVTALTANTTFQSAVTNITTTNGAIVVQDEGTPLATNAGTLNFVGAGVTAIGTGTTKTITIPGGGSSQWTYVSKKTFANSSTQQDFTSLALHDQYMLVWNVKNEAADQLTINITLNNITAANTYSAVLMSNSAISATLATVYRVTASTGGSLQGIVIGETQISGKHNNGVKSVVGNVSSPNPTDSISIRGFSTGDSADLSSIEIIPTNAVTGTVELWYKDAQ